jgi:acyl-CoA synthetase (AMP-forming)/AMP-acid ligase II
MNAPTMREVMSTWADREPERTAVSFVSFVGARDQCQSRSSEALDRRARAIAAMLLTRMRQGDRALLVYPSGIAFVEAFLGCLYAGVIPVALAIPRSRTQSRIALIAQDADARVLLTDSQGLGQLPGLLDLQVEMLATDDVPDALASDYRASALDETDVAFLQYTSGSTGQPKGVRISHRSLLANLAHIGKAFGHDPSSVAVNWLPMHHDMGLIGALLHPLFEGFHSVLMSPAAFVQRPSRWLQMIARFGGTSCGGPSFGFRHCVARIGEADAALHDLSTWQVAFCGAEPIQISSLEGFAGRFASAGFCAANFLPCYGLAEATLFVCGESPQKGLRKQRFDIRALEQGQAVPTAEGRELVSCGAPSDTTVTAILDAQGEVCGAGYVGEVLVAGPGVGKGYWNVGNAANDQFDVRLEAFPGHTFLRTGDLGFVHKEGLFITGRIKDIIIVEGRNLAPQDVEWSIVECHATVHDAMVFGVHAEDGERVIVLAEINVRELDVTLKSVAAGIRGTISARHGITPAALILVKVGALPRTTSGKPMRAQARALYAHGDLENLLVWTRPDLSATGYGDIRLSLQGERD